VRPSNLGLGYGGFKEATHLNKQKEEAEKRREEKKQNQQQGHDGAAQQQGSGWKSALPTVQDLLQDESWRASHPGTEQGQEPSDKKKRVLSKAKQSVVSYKEILEKQQQLSKEMKIIDMRGPPAVDTAATTTPTDQPPPLAEELLYNISMLMGAYESKLYSAHQMETSVRRKLENMRADAQALQNRKRELEQRYDKVSKAIAVLDEMKESMSTSTGTSHDMERIQAQLQQLAGTFSAEERASFHFAESILPSLLDPMLHRELVEKWHPLSFTIEDSQRVIQGAIDAILPALSMESLQEQFKAIQSIWAKYILPRVQKSFEDSDWSQDDGSVDQCVSLYELLRNLAIQMTQPLSVSKIKLEDSQHVLPANEVDEESQATSILKSMVHKSLILNTVHPKLLGLMSGWKPKFENSSVMNPLHAMVLPWIPHLDHQGILQPLLQDCRTKLRGCLSSLQKKMPEDRVFLHQAIRVIRPWRGVLKARYMEEMVSSYIMPKLARAISKKRLGLSDTREDWTLVDILLELYEDRLLSDSDFLSVVEGEVLSQWCNAFYDWTQDHTKDPLSFQKLLANKYSTWRNYLMEGLGNVEQLSKGRQLLRSDSIVCRHLLAMLLMIQNGEYLGSNGNVPCPPTTNYRVVLSRRTMEANKRAAEELSRMDATGRGSGTTTDAAQEARIRLSTQGHSHTPTFREVVAEFARERDILFQPRLGNKAAKVDGKQVFVMGSIPIYLDSNVVYAQKGNEWEPISVDELGQRALSSAR